MAEQPRTLILTHEHADFDAVASLLAAWLITPDALPLLPRLVNRNVRGFLALYGPDLPFAEPEDATHTKIERVILVDTQALPSMRGIGPEAAVTVVDHHPPAESLPPNWTQHAERVGATTTLLVERIVERRVSLTPEQATLLLLGIYEDTGSLSYADTTGRDAYAAGYLLEHGVNLAQVREFLQHALSAEQRTLYNRLIESAQSYDVHGHTVVVAAAQSVETPDELSTVAHRVRDLLEPDALFILVQFDSHIQIIARSTGDAIDVGAACQAFGGGGHARAAAALVREGNLRDIHNRLLEELRRMARPGLTVGQIMSRGGQTLEAAVTVAEAARRMQRTGFEGYPILKQGRVAGLLTRRAVDRAMNHKMGGRPISAVMEEGTVTVMPDDSVEKLERLMITHGWGQVPVVDADGRVVWIVTRTDVLKQWAAQARPTRRAEIAARLERALDPVLLALVREVAATARRLNASVYIVGGIVRDLLLGQPLYDVDFVIEGDAAALAQTLAREHGGRVKSHARFGTAKWIVPRGALSTGSDATDGAPRAAARTPPSAVDFVTARTEFYTHQKALPQIEQSSIKQDLHRRDFTINAMAICLDADRFGELLDFYGGEHDLREGLIRVLHSISFVDDPTRMLRAVRFEQRFGFRIDARTQSLMTGALDLLDRVSGARIRNEIELIFSETQPENAVCRLAELGILSRLSPKLTCDDWLLAKFVEAREAQPEDVPFVYYALLTCRLDAASLGALSGRLGLPSAIDADLHDLANLRRSARHIRDAHKASEVHQRLSVYSERVLRATRLITEDDRVRSQIDWFLRELRHVKPSVDGAVLRALGLKPGPQYRRILNALRDALLDGEVQSGEPERDFVRQHISGGAA